MIIGINTLFLIPNRVGGTEYYTRSFLKHLEKQDNNNSYVVFCNKENFDTFEFNSKKWNKVLCPISSGNRIVRILYEQLVLPFFVSSNGCQLLHSFGYFGPIFGYFKKVVTVHDANWKDCPDDVSKFQIFILNILISLNIYVSQKIITDSEFSKERLVKYFPKQKDKIEVIPGAVEDDFIELLKRKDKPFVEGKYILCVSKFYPHKKIPYLISLFKEIEKNNTDLKLVLVGRDGIEEQKVVEMINKDSRIIHFEKAKYTDLVNLYKNASAFVFPSTYEGFGYPVYEAVAAGIPVFVSDKKIYAKQYSDYLFDLSLDIKRDSQKVLMSTDKKAGAAVLFSYKESVTQLIDVYQGISERN